MKFHAASRPKDSFEPGSSQTSNAQTFNAQPSTAQTVNTQAVSAQTNPSPANHTIANPNPTLAADRLFQTASQGLWLAILTLGALALLSWRLGATSLNDWDEAIYAQVAKEIVTSGDWLTLHWGYEPWFHKPPLFMWATAGFFKLFGVSEFWARFPSVLAGAGLVGCTYLIAAKLEGHLVGLISVAVLMTNYTFVHFSRFGTTDIALTFFSYLAIFAYLCVVQGRRRAWYGVGAAIAAAAMIKGVAGLGIAIALALTLLITGRVAQTLRCSAFWGSLGLAGLIVIPWHAAMLALHGQAFVDQYLLYHVVERSTGGGLEGNEGGIFYYFGVLGKGFFPWVYLLPFGLWKQLKTLWQPVKQQFAKAAPRQSFLGLPTAQPASPPRSFIARLQSRADLILPIFVAVIFGGFSLSSTKLPWYIIPIYPALAIWIGSLLRQAVTGRDRLGWIGLLVSGTAVMALFPADIEFLSDSLQQIVAVAGLMTLTLLSVAVFEFGWQRQVLSVALCGVFVLAGFREIRGSFIGHEDPVATLSQAAEVAEATADSQNTPRLIVAQLSERLYVPTPLFYSNRPINWIRSVGELAKATEPNRRQDILLATADIERLKNSYDIDIYAKKGELTYAGIQKRAQKFADERFSGLTKARQQALASQPQQKRP
jgi:4-amino-4-deoxy-L-arabinose transferase-like glycosyltransferase